MFSWVSIQQIPVLVNSDVVKLPCRYPGLRINFVLLYMVFHIFPTSVSIIIFVSFWFQDENFSSIFKAKLMFRTFLYKL